MDDRTANRVSLAESLDRMRTIERVWYREYMRWLFFGEIVGCCLVVGAIAVAANPPFLMIFDTKNLAFLVAALAAINTFIDPLARAEGYGRAVTELQVAMQPVDGETEAEAKKRLHAAEAQGLRDIRARSVARRPEPATAHRNN